MFRFLEVFLRYARWILGTLVLLGLLAGGPLRGAFQTLTAEWALAVDGAEAAEAAEVECEDDEEVTLGARAPLPNHGASRRFLTTAVVAGSRSGVASSLLRPPNA